jgi:hypothetical protein
MSDTSIEQLLQEAQEEQDKLTRERALAEAKAPIQKKSEQDRIASAKDLQAKLTDIEKLVADYESTLPTSRVILTSLKGKLKTIFDSLNSLPQKDRDGIDTIISGDKKQSEDLQAAINEYEKPLAKPSFDQPPTAIAEAQAREQAAFAEQQTMERAYDELFKRVKSIGDKLKGLETRTTSLQTALRDKPHERINYFHAKELSAELNDVQQWMIEAGPLKTQLKQALTDLGAAQIQLLKAKLDHGGLVEENKQAKVQLADYRQRRTENIIRKINAMPIQPAPPPNTPPAQPGGAG